MFQKAFAASAVALLLMAAPMVLAAQEKEVHAAEQVSVLGWFSGIWSDIAAWFASQAVPPPVDSFREGSCSLDPDGCPGGV